MGPRLCSRGNGQVEQFGPAHALLQWGRGSVAAEIRIDRTMSVGMSLQWGRGSVAAEMTASLALESSYGFNGARLCSRGNTFGGSSRSARVLQWGRGSVAAEMRTTSTLGDRARFNGAAAL